MKRADIAEELGLIHKANGGLDPRAVVRWAQRHPKSALHSRFTWDDTRAAQEFRLWQARQIIVEVEVIYPDGKKRQVYVSPVESRGRGGYVALADVMSDAQRREAYLRQALAEYERVGEKYEDLVELAGVREAVKQVRARSKRRKSAA